MANVKGHRDCGGGQHLAANAVHCGRRREGVLRAGQSRYDLYMVLWMEKLTPRHVRRDETKNICASNIFTFKILQK